MPQGVVSCFRNFVFPCSPVACLVGHAWAWLDYHLALFFQMPQAPGLAASYGFPPRALCLCHVPSERHFA